MIVLLMVLILGRASSSTILLRWSQEVLSLVHPFLSMCLIFTYVICNIELKFKIVYYIRFLYLVDFIYYIRFLYLLDFPPSFFRNKTHPNIKTIQNHSRKNMLKTKFFFFIKKNQVLYNYCQGCNNFSTSTNPSLNTTVPF